MYQSPSLSPPPLPPLPLEQQDVEVDRAEEVQLQKVLEPGIDADTGTYSSIDIYLVDN